MNAKQKKVYKFIGGPADGINIGMDPDEASKVLTYDEQDGTAKAHKYFAYRFATLSMNTCFYYHESLTATQALNIIIEQYTGRSK